MQSGRWLRCKARPPWLTCSGLPVMATRDLAQRPDRVSYMLSLPPSSPFSPFLLPPLIWEDERACVWRGGRWESAYLGT